MKTSTPKNRAVARQAGNDRKVGQYKPPGGSDFSAQIARQITGRTTGQRIYDSVYKRK